MKGSQMYKEDISISVQIKHKGEKSGCPSFFLKQKLDTGSVGHHVQPGLTV